jgi:hypothetical protein
LEDLFELETKESRMTPREPHSGGRAAIRSLDRLYPLVDPVDLDGAAVIGERT